MKMTCLRAGAIRLCLAMMLALLVIPGYIVAPVLFAGAGSQALAGELAGRIFHLSLVTLLFLAAAVASFWWRMQSDGQIIGRRSWILLAALCLLVAINVFGLAPLMADIKQQMGPIDLIPKDNPLRQKFGMWHGISAVLHLLASIVAAMLVATSPIGNDSKKGTCPSL
ncbi:DUF4149 domain-containing protein [Mariprofundus erugo]|uniref:DUF4149 domain-containing protein n=1 Tax=Mariprofundus erugo TaxID=2528639 RepID=UPI0010FE7EB0|nr:DUF4149 domain-containing protein [Mariprofundus erugo]TLS75641.1 DUF4149 domain-containing protein [Mariprofundus erugo]